MTPEINIDANISNSVFKKMTFYPKGSVAPSVGEYACICTRNNSSVSIPLHCNRKLSVKTSIDFLNSNYFFVQVKYRCTVCIVKESFFMCMFYFTYLRLHYLIAHFKNIEMFLKNHLHNHRVYSNENETGATKSLFKRRHACILRFSSDCSSFICMLSR